MPRLDDWALWRTVAGDAVLTGFVSGHPHQRDGTAVRTSQVRVLQASVARTLNTTYELGERCADPRRWRLKHLTVGLNGAQPIHDLSEGQP